MAAAGGTAGLALTHPLAAPSAGKYRENSYAVTSLLILDEAKGRAEVTPPSSSRTAQPRPQGRPEAGSALSAPAARKDRRPQNPRSASRRRYLLGLGEVEPEAAPGAELLPLAEVHYEEGALETAPSASAFWEQSCGGNGRQSKGWETQEPRARGLGRQEACIGSFSSLLPPVRYVT